MGKNQNIKKMADEVFCQCLRTILTKFQPLIMHHAFWQILSKKCEIIENRRKLPKMPNLSKIVFSSDFFLAKASC